MASPAKVLANQVNSKRSTGPKTAAGKARSARNAATHGLTIGYLVVEESEREAYEEFASQFRAAAQPDGLLETATCQQIVDAAWRLRKIHSLHARMAAESHLDPLANPECAAALKQLARYRAATEMAFYRSMKTLQEIQTRRAARTRHLLEIEKVELPIHVEPSVYGRARWSTEDRENYLTMHGRLGPNQIWDLEVDEFHQAAWVRRPDPPSGGTKPVNHAELPVQSQSAFCPAPKQETGPGPKAPTLDEYFAALLRERSQPEDR